MVEEVCRWRFGNPSKVGLFLDFASGWGRSTRYLTDVIPSARIFAADAVAEAMAFQSSEFGVRTFVTTASPSSFAPSEKFDVILACSFFSHLPDRTFAKWLHQLAGSLSRDGVLLFSTHGMELLWAGAAPNESGMVFVSSSESQVLNPEEYGTCYVTEAYVRNAVRTALGDDLELSFWRRGLAGHQDFYVLSRGTSRPPELSLYPWGDVDRFDRGRWLKLEGWCADLTHMGRVESVELVVDTSVRDSCAPASSGPSNTEHLPGRHEWSGRWELRVPRSEVGEDDVISLWARNSAGRQNLIGLGTLRQFPETET